MEGLLYKPKFSKTNIVWQLNIAVKGLYVKSTDRKVELKVNVLVT